MGGYGSFSKYYVATYRLAYSNNGLTWMDYTENGKVKVRN